MPKRRPLDSAVSCYGVWLPKSIGDLETFSIKIMYRTLTTTIHCDVMTNRNGTDGHTSILLLVTIDGDGPSK